MPETKIVQPDNGYFQVWICADGVRRRVSTECTGWVRRNKFEARRLDAATKARLEAKYAEPTAYTPCGHEDFPCCGCDQ